MDRHDGLGSPGHGSRDLARVDQQVIRIDVDQNWDRTDPGSCFSRGDEGVRWHDHLTARPYTDCAQRELEAIRAIGNSDAVGDTDEFGVRAFELVHSLTADERRSGEDVSQTGLDLIGHLGMLSG